ncbi:phosphoribosylglycinamide formyltransferase [Alphaproteobacteria bacterium HT1-32]|nr:phosphoribosylglycinamide formyltransferase [Alphaproteobacteria bacterium HT1-32]
MAVLKIGVLISGRGSNLQALIDACAGDGFPAKIAVVISNKPDAYGLERARLAGISTITVPHDTFSSREAFDQEVDRHLREAGVKLVCLAGFMRLLSEQFVRGWKDRMINIHPSLLPSFKGLNTHARTLQAGVKIAGCTVHYVRPEMDEGPIIMQAAVPVLAGDSEENLADRILVQEHLIYPAAVRLIAEGRVRVAGETCIITGSGKNSGLSEALISPK